MFGRAFSVVVANAVRASLRSLDAATIKMQFGHWRERLRFAPFALISMISISTVSFVSAANAECRAPQKTCYRIQQCALDTEARRADDRARIRRGVAEGNGNLVWQGASACQNDLGQKSDFDLDSGGCSDNEYLQHGKLAVNGQCDQAQRKEVWYCGVKVDRGYRPLGRMSISGGDCSGEAKVDALCSCPLGNGQVYKQLE